MHSTSFPVKTLGTGRLASSRAQVNLVPENEAFITDSGVIASTQSVVAPTRPAPVLIPMYPLDETKTTKLNGVLVAGMTEVTKVPKVSEVPEVPEVPEEALIKTDCPEGRATGRRKCARAQVKLVAGTGELIINGQLGRSYLHYNPAYLSAVQAPFEAVRLNQQYDTIVVTRGGGLTGQAEAIRLGVARALCRIDGLHRSALKRKGYLTRNSLCKERKKYGLKKARKAPQFSKR